MKTAQELLDERIAELTVKSQDGKITDAEYAELGKALLQTEGDLIKSYKKYSKKADEEKKDYSKRMMKMGYTKKAKDEDDDKYAGRMKYMKAQGFQGGDSDEGDDKSTKSTETKEDLVKSAKEYLAERRNQIERSSEMEESLQKAQTQLTVYESMLKGYQDNELLTTVQSSLSALFDVIKSQNKDIEALKSVVAENGAGETLMAKSQEESNEAFSMVEKVMKSLDSRIEKIEKEPSSIGKPTGGLTKSQILDRFGKMIDSRYDENGESKGSEMTKSLLTAPKGLISKILLKGAQESKIEGRLVTKFELANGNPLSLPQAAQQFVTSELPKWQTPST